MSELKYTARRAYIRFQDHNINLTSCAVLIKKGHYYMYHHVQFYKDAHEVQASKVHLLKILKKIINNDKIFKSIYFYFSKKIYHLVKTTLSC